MEYSPNQRLVIDAAKKELKNYSWYTGVCLDKLPDDNTCKKAFEFSVNVLIQDTEYWDNW